LEIARERPEISPCSSSDQLDCTRFTDGVSIRPHPKPIRKSPGANAQTPGLPATRASSTAIPMIVVMKPAMISVRWGRRLANRSAPRDESRIPAVAAVKMTPVWIAL
jgi:hypothetical protein